MSQMIELYLKKFYQQTKHLPEESSLIVTVYNAIPTRGVFINRDGAGADKYFLGCTGLFIDGDDTGLQDGERRDMCRQDTEAAGE